VLAENLGQGLPSRDFSLPFAMIGLVI
jgi:hypothetical protein